MNIPFHKPEISSDEINIVIKSLKSGWLTMGPKTLEFENEFKKYIDIKYAISTSSATAALHLSLKSLGISADDEVIIPTNTFVATAEAVAYLRAKPVLCDIDYNSHNIDANKIENLITPKTKAIIPVHFGGQPCDMDEISELAKRHNIKIVEDAAHSLPASYKNKKIGGIGDLTCFSFYATKTLTTGEGGMVVSNNKNYYNKILLKRMHGIDRNAWNRYDQDTDWYYEVTDLGYKYNITDIQSSLGLAQLSKIDLMTEKRKKIYKAYINEFENKIECIKIKKDRISSYHLFVIKVENRNDLFRQLKNKGIHTSVHFIPIHKHPYYISTYNYKNKDYPVANQIYEKSLSLPIYPSLTEEELDYIISNVLKYSNI